jgi:hypothetical protein
VRGRNLAYVTRLAEKRNIPFAVAGGIALVVTIAYFRLPDSLITQMERKSIATGWAGDWIYRVLAVVAVLQAVYVGTILRPERIARVLPAGVVTRTIKYAVFRGAAHGAAVAFPLTLVYGIAAFWLTGGRASTWLFVVVMTLQAAWYFRQLGKLAEWLERRPAPPPEPPSWQKWKPEPETYVPPLARALLRGGTPPRDESE